MAVAEARRTRVGFFGLGRMARIHLETMLDRPDTVVAALCEPSAAAVDGARSLFERRGIRMPPNEPDWTRFIERFAGELDAVFIITPHVLHFAQASACLEARFDVLLEKPMVMTTTEAKALIETRDRTGRHLVVAFQGSLSAQVREAARLLRSGSLGPILNVGALVWENWKPKTDGTWRQEPDAAGGGFLFDTGAHMLNTVADIAGEPFTEIAAWLENDGTPVDVRAVVMGRLASGALVTMNACGNAIPSCHSDIRVFTTKAIVQTGIWGETLSVQRAGRQRLRRFRSMRPVDVWDQFLQVRNGRIDNPSPPETGLRMAELWDAIRASAARGGAVVRDLAVVPEPAATRANASGSGDAHVTPLERHVGTTPLEIEAALS